MEEYQQHTTVLGIVINLKKLTRGYKNKYIGIIFLFLAIHLRGFNFFHQATKASGWILLRLRPMI